MAVPPARNSKYSTDFPDGDPGSRPTTVPFFTASPCFTRNVSSRRTRKRDRHRAARSARSRTRRRTRRTRPPPPRPTSRAPPKQLRSPRHGSRSSRRSRVVLASERVTTFPPPGVESPPERDANRRGASADSRPPPTPCRISARRSRSFTCRSTRETTDSIRAIFARRDLSSFSLRFFSRSMSARRRRSSSCRERSVSPTFFSMVLFLSVTATCRSRPESSSSFRSRAG